MNYKNIIRFLDDLEKEKPHFYNLLFNNNSSGIDIYEMAAQCKNLFKKYNMVEEYCFDSYGGSNIHLARKRKYFIELRITNKNNSYLNNNYYGVVIFIEDLMKYKHIFDFSIIEMTEEELFYIELKELFGNKKG